MPYAILGFELHLTQCIDRISTHSYHRLPLGSEEAASEIEHHGSDGFGHMDEIGHDDSTEKGKR